MQTLQMLAGDQHCFLHSHCLHDHKNITGIQVVWVLTHPEILFLCLLYLTLPHQHHYHRSFTGTNRE